MKIDELFQELEMLRELLRIKFFLDFDEKILYNRSVKENGCRILPNEFVGDISTCEAEHH